MGNDCIASSLPSFPRSRWFVKEVEWLASAVCNASTGNLLIQVVVRFIKEFLIAVSNFISFYASNYSPMYFKSFVPKKLGFNRNSGYRLNSPCMSFRGKRSGISNRFTGYSLNYCIVLDVWKINQLSFHYWVDFISLIVFYGKLGIIAVKICEILLERMFNGEIGWA